MNSPQASSPASLLEKQLLSRLPALLAGHKRHVITALTLILVSAFVLQNYKQGTQSGFPQGDPPWVRDNNILVVCGYFLLLLAVFASIFERIVETIIGLTRGRTRDELSLEVDDAVRARKDNRTDELDQAFRERLLAAEIRLKNFRADTRLFSQLACLAAGCCLATVINLPIAEVFVSKELADTDSARLLEILAAGVLIAGGSEPLHDIVTGISKSVRNIAAISNRTTP